MTTQELCAGCGKQLLPENSWMEDGCPCNTPAGCNDGNALISKWRWEAAQKWQHRATEAEKDRDNWKKTYEAALSRFQRDSLRAEDADRYEQWLLDLGRISGCGHIDERLPVCIEQEFQKLREELAIAKEDVRLYKPLTDDEIEEALLSIEDTPIDDAEIDAIVAKVTDPLYRPTEPEHVLLIAKVRQLQRRLDEISCALANEGPHTIEHLLACARLGKETTIIGRGRLNTLYEAEKKCEELKAHLAMRVELGENP